MGGKISVPEDKLPPIITEIRAYKQQLFKPDVKSIRYQLFLMLDDIIFSLDEFYKDSDPNLISTYIRDSSGISIDDAKLIIQMIVKNSNCEEVAQSNLQIIMPSMNVQFKDPNTKQICYVSPSKCENLYKSLFTSPYQSSWGKYKPKKLFDFDSKMQSFYKEELQQLYDSFNEYLALRPDRCMAVASNPFTKIFTNNITDRAYLGYDIPSKPFNWIPNIHQAAYNGDVQSLAYTLYLVPLLINCPDDKGLTPAHFAVLGKSDKVILFLHENRANFIISNDAGFLPIHLASDSKIIQTLLSIGCNMNARNNKGESLLELKTKDFDKKIIEKLIVNGVDILESSPTGYYWMQYAIHNEYFGDMTFLQFQKFVRKLLPKKNSNPIYNEIIGRDVNSCDIEDEKDLNRSVDCSDIPRIKVLLALGAHCDRFIEGTDMTMLIECSLQNKANIAQLLLENFCDPNKENVHKQNCFWICADHGYYDLATLMAQYQCNINSIDETGNTLLHIAYENHRNDLFEFLLKTGCSPNIKNKNKESVLFIAFQNKDYKTAEMLQDQYKGDINIQAKGGNTLAHYSILQNDLDSLFYYIKRGIDINIKNDKGYSIFMIAIINLNDLDLFAKLLSFKADINSQDIDGNTPLLNALKLKDFNKEKVEFLINNDCDINKQNKNGEFPISVCIRRQFDDLAECLISKNCVINDPKTKNEPILIALQLHNQYWVERLFKQNANALNETASILNLYLQEPYYKHEILEQIHGINLKIGYPLQIAMKKNDFKTASYLWNITKNYPDLRKFVTSVKDENGMIPLSVAILTSCNELINELINPNFDCISIDNKGMTPFMYACHMNYIVVMTSLDVIIPESNRSLVDSSNNSALTYAANNNSIGFCNRMFVENVDINDINVDKYGIIEKYRYLEDHLLKMREKILKAQDFAMKACEYYDNEYAKCQSQLKKNQNAYEKSQKKIEKLDANDDPTSLQKKLDKNASNCLESQNKLKEIEKNLTNARKIYEKYKFRQQMLAKVTRHDLITDLERVEEYGQYDNDIDDVSGNCTIC